VITPDDPGEVPTYRTDAVPVAPEEPSLPATVKLPRMLLLIPLGMVLLVAAGVVIAVVALGGDDGESGPLGGEVLTAQGYDDLVAAVADEAGSSRVFDAVLYPEYAVVSIPADETTQREESYYWDGSDLSSNDSKSTSSSERFDLTAVDGQVLVDLVARARTLVEEPTTWYAIVRAPDANGSMVSAYATNEYGETAYLSARSDGTVTYDSTAQ
jgi:hypothetical protein